MIKYVLIGINNDESNKIQEIFNKNYFFEFLGNYQDTNTGMEFILKNLPHLIIINIDKVKNAFHYIDECKKYHLNSFNYICYSKNKDKAYQAIKNNAIDYLISPANNLEIRKSMMRYKKNFDDENSKSICLKSNNDFQFLNIDDIILLKADNNTTDFILTNNKKVTAYKCLKYFENDLPKCFLRIHKSFIINSKYVKRINYGKCNFLIDQLNSNIPFSKTYNHNVNYIKNSLDQKTSFQLN